MKTTPSMNFKSSVLALTLAFTMSGCSNMFAQSKSNSKSEDYLYHDSHFHLTNYIQEGITIKKYLEIMGSKVGRSTLFGIPLQQQWSFQNSGEFGPTYYLQSDAPLYYYSFTDAYIAMQFNSLTEEEKKRFDPMITGFNPADMYAWKHIERVLKTFPGVFSGIGEFSIHKEFVSSKVAGEVASLANPAMDSVLSFAGKTGLVVLFHNDIDIPFAKEKAEPVYLNQMKALLKRHPEATVIWAHTGLGRVVHPVQYGGSRTPERSSNHIGVIEDMLEDPELSHLYFDISWDEVAKYVISSPQSIQNTANLLNSFPDRILFGTDVVAPPSEDFYFSVYKMYQPLWDALKPETREKVLKTNYERLFDKAKIDVRAWEKENIE